MQRSWDIFCSVVDNFGDIGVCWRLSRQLAAEHGQRVRLWVDDLASLNRLYHEADAARPVQHIAGVEVRKWGGSSARLWPSIEVADIVIEGFGVQLPRDYIEAMAQRQPKPVWINLEYLSAEDWVASHHGLPSPQPDGLLTKYFFFPGFTEASGGLIIERGLKAERDRFQASPAAIADFRQKLGIRDTPTDQQRLWLSLFCYENAALPGLIDAWSASSMPITCLVPEGRPLEQISSMLGLSMSPGSRIELGQGRLRISAIPFVEQDDFDRLLWSGDINFVRGEDSFVRAQFAGRPMTWQAYPQDEGAHLNKVSAFVALYGNGLAADPAVTVAAVFDAWNRQSTDIGRAWATYAAQLPVLTDYAASWAERLLAGPNLAERLAQFCEIQLK
jgi:uncharacterized repeat protein (TIGR03837 family)